MLIQCLDGDNPLFWAHLDQPHRRVLDTFEIHDLTGWSLPFYPIFIPISGPLGHNASSEKERRQSKPHHKSSKQAKIPIDREVVLKVDPEQLPADAIFKGYEDVVVQDLEIRTDHVQFHKEKYYSPGQKRTYLAPLPAGYHGQFGPKVRAWVVAMYYAGQMSEPKILEVLQTAGLLMSAGQLSNMLIKDQEVFHAERANILQAGLESAPWQHLDSTGTRVNGHNQHCHVLCNQLYTVYCTLPSKDRMSMRSAPSWGI